MTKLHLAQRRNTHLTVQVTEKSSGRYGFRNNWIQGSVVSKDFILVSPSCGTVDMMANKAEDPQSLKIVILVDSELISSPGELHVDSRSSLGHMPMRQ